MSILSDAYTIDEMDVFRIEMINGKKYIHFNNYAYSVDDNVPDFFRNEEYALLMAPLDEALEFGLEYWYTENENNVRQNAQEMTPAEIVEYFKRLNNGTYPTFISIEDIDNDIPCGIYMTSMYAD